MNKILALIILFTYSLCYSQGESLDDNKYRFPKRVFKEEYKKRKYKPYKGKITVIDKNNIRYGDKILTIPTLKEDYMLIFT